MQLNPRAALLLVLDKPEFRIGMIYHFEVEIDLLNDGWYFPFSHDGWIGGRKFVEDFSLKQGFPDFSCQ